MKFVTVRDDKLAVLEFYGADENEVVLAELEQGDVDGLAAALEDAPRYMVSSSVDEHPWAQAMVDALSAEPAAD